jgi:hypothetical protein
VEELQEHHPRSSEEAGGHGVQQSGVHDNRVASLASEFLDPDVDAADDRTGRQVAVDAVGSPPLCHRSHSQGSTVLRYAFTSCERTGRCLPADLLAWSAGVSPVTTSVPPPRGRTGARWAKTASMVSPRSWESRCQPLVGTSQAVPRRGNVTSGRPQCAGRCAAGPEQVVDDRAELARGHRVEVSGAGQFLELRGRVHRPGLRPVRVHRVRAGQVLPQALAHGRDFGWGNRRGKTQEATAVKLITMSRRDSMPLPASHAATAAVPR